MPKVLVIVGPTASGKSALAVELARKFSGEIISADSRQVYNGLDIGSGKVTKREMRGVPHYLLDVASPRRTFTAADYRRKGQAALKKILMRGKLPIVVGGTGFYIDALLYNYDLPDVKPDPKLRAKLDARSADELFKQLQKLDPRRAATIDRHNKRRLARALEIVLVTRKPVPDLTRSSKHASGYDILTIGLAPAREILKKSVAKRLAARLKKGMVREVEQLHKNGVSWQRLDDLGLEYRAVSRFLRGIITASEMKHAIQKESEQYAKRQMTWFKRNPEIAWFTIKKGPDQRMVRLIKEFVKR